MRYLINYEEEILSLAGQLGKLLKVIRHSDPSAEELKHLLYKKYQQRLADLVKKTKTQFEWIEFRDFVNDLLKNNKFSGFDDNNNVILNKLLKDFENKFVEKQVLTEFTPPDPEHIRKIIKSRQKNKSLSKNRPEETINYQTDDIMEMIEYTQKRRQAKASLEKLVNAVKKLNPQSLEQKINATFNDGKKV